MLSVNEFEKNEQAVKDFFTSNEMPVDTNSFYAKYCFNSAQLGCHIIDNIMLHYTDDGYGHHRMVLNGLSDKDPQLASVCEPNTAFQHFVCRNKILEVKGDYQGNTYEVMINIL